MNLFQRYQDAIRGRKALPLGLAVDIDEKQFDWQMSSIDRRRPDYGSESRWLFGSDGQTGDRVAVKIKSGSKRAKTHWRPGTLEVHSDRRIVQLDDGWRIAAVPGAVRMLPFLEDPAGTIGRFGRLALAQMAVRGTPEMKERAITLSISGQQAIQEMTRKNFLAGHGRSLER